MGEGIRGLEPEGQPLRGPVRIPDGGAGICVGTYKTPRGQENVGQWQGGGRHLLRGSTTSQVTGAEGLPTGFLTTRCGF